MRSKKYLPTFLLLLGALGTAMAQTAQTAAENTKANGFSDIMTTSFLIISVALFVIVILVVLRTNSLLTKHLINLERGGAASGEAGAYPVQDDFLTRLRKKYWENPVPIEREGDIMLDHNYDGIRELDNHLPPWWVNLFYITILFAGVYMWYYHFGGTGPSSADEYKISVEKAKKEMATALAGKANAVDEASVTALTDASALSDGENTFKSTCAACHGQKGEGMVGPNLTDEYWLHGGGIKNVFKTIKYGVPEKGMIAWASQLKPSDIQKVASYILTLKGSNPPNPKAPQGSVWTEEGAAAPAATPAKDSTATVKPK